MADEVHNVGGLRLDELENNAGAEERQCSEIKVSCSSEYEAYSYNERHDIWTLVTLKAPCQVEEEGDKKQPPVDIVAVIDKSGSMAGDKLNLVKKTLAFVLTQLTDRDRFSVVTYDTNVYLNFGLKKMTKENKEFAEAKIKAIKDGSSTNLCGGLMKGLVQMLNRAEKNDIASVLLFTDGLANHGITSSDGIVAAMADPKRFDGPTSGSSNPRMQQQVQRNQQPQPHQSWLRNIFGGSSSRNANASAVPVVQRQSQSPIPMEVENEEPVPDQSCNNQAASASTSDYSVYTFGFGADHNPDMLRNISDAGNGMYYFIESEDKIAESFGHCLGGLMSTVAQGIQLQVDLEEGVAIKEIHTVRPSEKLNDKSLKVNVGDLQSEEKRDVVLELTIDAISIPRNDTKQPLFKARIDYFNVIENNLSTSYGDLGVLRPEPSAVVHERENMNRDVGEQRARVKMTKALKKSSASAALGNLGDARSILRREIESNREMSEGYEDLGYAAMANDMEAVYDTYETESVYRQKGTKLQMNMEQQYMQQRSSNLSSEAFQTKGKMKKRALAKSFITKK